MEWAVIWRSRCVRILPRAVPRANGYERERETGRPQSVATPVELRLNELGSRRGLDRCRGERGRRHACRRTNNESGMTGENQQECEGDTPAERPEMTSPPTHPRRA